MQSRFEERGFVRTRRRECGCECRRDIEEDPECNESSHDPADERVNGSNEFDESDKEEGEGDLKKKRKECGKFEDAILSEPLPTKKPYATAFLCCDAIHS